MYPVAQQLKRNANEDLKMTLPSIQRLSRWLAAVVFALLGGCAAIPGSGFGKVEHGFNLEIVGQPAISDVLIRYGEFQRMFCDKDIPCRKGYGTFYGVYMPIQDQMQVTWKTADGQQHQAVVPVRGKVHDLSRFRRLFLRFNGEQLVVLQGSYYQNPGLAGWEEAPLYP